MPTTARSSSAGIGGSSLLLLLTTLSGRASATPELTLDWSAPSDCPSREAVQSEVARLLGNAQRKRFPVVVDAQVSELTSARGFQAELVMNSGEHTSKRKLTAATCTEVSNAAALIIALAIDPGGVSVPHEEAPPNSEPEPKAASAKSRAQVSAGARVGIDSGALPAGLSGGAEGLIGLRYSGLWLEVFAGYYGLNSTDVEPHPSAAFSFELWSAGMLGCFLYEAHPLAVGPCAGVEAGRIAAKSSGIQNPATVSDRWIALLAGAQAAYALSDPLSLRLDIGAIAPLQRPSFTIAGLDTAPRQVARVAIRTKLGLVLSF